MARLNLHPITVARIEQGISQEHLAELSGLSIPSLSAIESGKRARVFVNELILVAKVLGIENWWELASPENKDVGPRRHRLSEEALKSLARNRIRRSAEARERYLAKQR